MPPLIQIYKIPEVYDPATIAHLARLTSYTQNLADALDILIKKLKTYGLWDLMDLVNVVHENESDSLLNLKGSTYDSTNVNGATFTASRGFDPILLGTDGTTPGYIDTNLTVDGTTLVSDYDNSLFVYQRTSTSNLLYLIGTANTNPFALYFDGSVSPDQISFHSNQFVSVAANTDTNLGFIGGTRRSATGSDAELLIGSTNYVGSALDAGSAPIDTNSLFVGCHNNGTGPNSIAVGHQISAWGIGAGLSTVQHSNLEITIQSFMLAIGAQV